MSNYISNKLGLKNYKITDNLKGKNIILINDFKYLKKKKFNIIKSYCISYKLNSDTDYATTDKISLYPWMVN